MTVVAKEQTQIVPTPRNKSALLSHSVEAVDHIVAVPSDWQGRYGARLPEEHLRLRLAGNLAGPAILVLGGISANRFVAQETSGSDGWWSDLVCPDGSIDTDQFCIVGIDYPPHTEKTEGAFCPEDFAHLIKLALDQAGIYRLTAFVGASFGGMIGLAFARAYPEALDRLAVICAAHRPDPMAQAWRLVQRQVIEFAQEAGQPERGINLARQLAMTTYRTPEEFRERFNPDLAAADNIAPYLSSRGEDYAGKTNPRRYLALSGAIDRHNEAPEEITTKALIIGFLSDRLVPISDLEELQRRLAGQSDLVAISSLYGHDAFLKETSKFSRHLKNFLAERHQ